MRARHDVRLLVVAALTWTLAIITVQAEVNAALVGAGVAALAAIVGMVGVCRYRLSRRNVGADARPDGCVVSCSLLVLALIASGVVVAHVAMAAPERASARAIAAESSVVTASVRIDSSTRTVSNRVWASGTIVGTHHPSTAAEVPERALPAGTPVALALAVDDLDETPGLGATVRVRGSATAADPGDQAAVLLFASSIDEIVPPGGILAVTDSLRRAFVEEAARSLPQPGGGLLPGLALGATGEVEDDLTRAMQLTSLTHLTAVSGANCAIVAAILMGLGAVCGLTLRWRCVVTAMGLAFFVMLVTPEPSVVRAAVMALIVLVTIALGRPGAGVATLALATIVLLWWNPWLATSYGFILSVAATAALLLAAGPLTAGLSRWMPAPLALSLAVPLSAQLVCGPIILLIADGLPLYGVAANLVAMPAAPVATILGMIACLVLPLPVIGTGLLGLAWLPSAWIAHTALVFAALPGASVEWPSGWWGLVTHLGLSVSVYLLISPIRMPGRRRFVRVCVRLAPGIVLAVVAGVSATASAMQSVLAPLVTPETWAIAQCDVGQGDAVVVRSADATALVDTGAEVPLLRRCLARLQVDRLDLLVVTHFDHDHVGAIDAIDVPVDTVMHGPGSSDDVAVLATLDAEVVTEARQGMSGALGLATWTVVWPPVQSRGFEVGNDTSAVMFFRGGGIPDLAILADVPAASQRFIVEKTDAPVQVVKVSHHGSADQDDALYWRLNPTIALIGVGADNDYGHPAPSTTDLLERLGAAVGRSDTGGLIVIGTDGHTGELWWWKERDDAESRGG